MMLQSHVIVLLLAFAGGFLHLVFHLLKTSEIIPSKNFRRLVIGSWGILTVLFVGSQIVPHLTKDRVRIACFPLFSSEEWPDMIAADGIYSVLRGARTGDCLVYPPDWSYDAADEDSASSAAYLLSYGRRIGLDFFMTERLDSESNGQYVFELSFYDTRGDTSIHTMTDSLDPENPGGFFHRAARCAFESFSVDFDSLSGPDLPDAEAWKQYGRGRYHQLHGDVCAAEQAFRDGIAVDSVNTGLKTGLSAVLLQQAYQRKTEGKFTEDLYIEAAGLLRRVVRMDSTQSAAYRILGQLYIQSERWNQAEQALGRALKYEKDDPFVYFYLSRLHPSRYEGSGFNTRERLLRHALALNPAFERARLALGDDYYFRNKYRKAEGVYVDLLSIHPRSLDALLALGKLYVVRNDALNIIRIYRRVLDIAPENADAYYNLGIAYYNDGKTEEAAGFFQKAIEIDNHADSHFYLGVIHAERGDTEKAVEYLRKRISLRQKFDDPVAEEARRYLNRLLSNG